MYLLQSTLLNFRLIFFPASSWKASEIIIFKLVIFLVWQSFFHQIILKNQCGLSKFLFSVLLLFLFFYFRHEILNHEWRNWTLIPCIVIVKLPWSIADTCGTAIQKKHLGILELLQPPEFNIHKHLHKKITH